MELSCQKFGLDLFRTICKDDYEKNIIYSPLSIYMALGMTLYGAKSETATQMMTTLNWDQSNSDSFHQQLSDCIKMSNVDEGNKGTMKIANKLFLDNQYQLLDLYTKAIDNLYKGGIENMDFISNPDKSCKDINLWVEHQTNGKIKDLLQQGNITNLTRLIIVNAVYFKNSWQNEFNASGDQIFHLFNGNSKATAMISKTHFYNYLTNSKLNFSAVKIPFKSIQNNDYSFMIILPNERCQLPELEKSIFQQEWESLLGDDLFERSSVSVTIPKFRIENSFSLKNELQNLGMVKPFSQSADFSSMSAQPELMIDDVVHKAFIDVDEHGVEAAAATAVRTRHQCIPIIPNDPIEFLCDHPFMFALINQGSLPLFLGHFALC